MSTPSGNDQGPSLLAASYSLIFLSAIAVTLRFYGRYVERKVGFWWDDWLSLVALAFVFVNCGLTIYWVHIGLGKHINEVSTPASRLLLIDYVNEIMYTNGISSVKVSVVLFYLRIFKTVKLYRSCCWAMIAILVIWCIFFDFRLIFTCVPVQKFWNSTIDHGSCRPEKPDYMATAVSNIVIDVLILTLPMPMIWRLNAPTLRKVGLVVIFVAGYSVVILSVLRLVSIIQLGSEPQEDISWNIANPELLVVCEISLALISSCLPSIFTLAKHVAREHFPSLAAKLTSSKGSSAANTVNIGFTSKPGHSRDVKNFAPLHDSIVQGSEEGLFSGVSGIGAHAEATARGDSQNSPWTDGPTRADIPLQEIHVRNDVDVRRELRS